ncbi:hypothetical protein D9615_003835 [Tricholomella constricta]|uniref:Uncharacterized protein n=1 Tax=Tricholomella constricta TaxID=117010 RepID=A0A8H5M778_9AGAR|nr:hypothetical protein D9615_003835 [Tricholomella constricta]
MAVAEVEVVRVQGPSTQSPSQSQSSLNGAVSESPAKYDFEIDRTTPGIIWIPHSKTDTERKCESFLLTLHPFPQLTVFIAKAKNTSLLENIQGDMEILKQELEDVKAEHWQTNIKEMIKGLETERVKVRKVIDGLKTERVKNKEVPAAWETCDRMAQAINNLVKIAVFTSQDDNGIQAARYVWDNRVTKGTKYRYRTIALAHGLVAGNIWRGS